jgi:prepilin-type N-terminal cleavage/methylation domain-containing protein
MDRVSARASGSKGFTLMEVMMAIVVLTVALLAVALTMSQGIMSTFIAQEQLIAKQKAREALESVFTSRSTTDLEFTDLQTQGDGGIFVSDWTALRGMGADGIALTDDDAGEDIETVVLAGSDGELGTPDDIERVLNNFQRRISFSDVLRPGGGVDEDIRMVTVDVRFANRGVWWTVTVNSYISRFA